MPVCKRMSGWLSSGICALIVLLAACLVAIPVNAADTGTYEIADYLITLEPQSSGQTRITYDQEWIVLSGHIPWITVGLPNSGFSVDDFSGSASAVKPDNSGSWSGVRIDLDKDYQPGQTFQVKFTVLQRNLIEKLPDSGIWRLVYTPGWYDRATIGHLVINLDSPVDSSTYSTLEPSPDKTLKKVMTWEKSNLPPGAKFTITVECRDGSFLAADAETSGGGIGTGWLILIGALVVIGVGALISYAIRQSRLAGEARLQHRIASTEKEMADNQERKKEIEEGFKEYVDEKGLEPDAQGRFYDRSYGNYITPAIWAAVIFSNRSSATQSTPINRGQSGCVACACVACACACACACAGGGAAGCSRKTVHECDRRQPIANVEFTTTNKNQPGH
jgi:hypothetical protein